MTVQANSSGHLRILWFLAFGAVVATIWRGYLGRNVEIDKGGMVLGCPIRIHGRSGATIPAVIDPRLSPPHACMPMTIN